ncbi:DNA-3-methyladenine glycosylase family protein [Oribacterium sp. WCC10]|uniref:DNA-3-methyladenine glycosylase family protein n=1 Tax=Oribacterium sp. WCC10 TaxID=1855343 RepID=UPI0008F35E50|nr:DNA glycosylase [Oribacterium sp. WCC10]SFG31606.1 N-glycosylase/DNA lyase [Oribacterium sp. WCC10]
MLHLTIDDFDLTAIAESGQCFRMTSPGIVGGFPLYKVVASDKCLLISRDPEGGECDFLAGCAEDEWKSFYKHYFDLDTDYQKYRNYASPDDDFLNECMGYGMGIRILNQDSWEMLISFIISQRKSVPAIRTTVERLCALSGKTSYVDATPWHEMNPDIPERISYHPFPDAETLAGYSIEEINSTGAGYRSGYIMEAARKVSTGELDLTGMTKAQDEVLLEELLKIQGVGIKVASCTALFGFHRLALCPEDVWMKRVKEQFYGGEWPEEYRPALGVLQQYMFYYARLEHEKDKIKRTKRENR